MKYYPKSVSPWKGHWCESARSASKLLFKKIATCKCASIRGVQGIFDWFSSSLFSYHEKAAEALCAVRIRTRLGVAYVSMFSVWIFFRLSNLLLATYHQAEIIIVIILSKDTTTRLAYSLVHEIWVTANMGKISFNDKVVTDCSGFWC